MDSTIWLGLIGGAITTFSFVPQVTKTWKTKSTADFSLGMLLLLCVGIFIWVVYGFMIDSVPVVLTNAISLVLSLLLLGFKLVYR